MRTDFDFNYDDQVNFNNFYYFHKAFSLEEIQKIHEVASAHEFITAVTDSKNEGDEDLELVRKSRIKWLKQSNTLPIKTAFLTGTGIVPPPEFTLLENDQISISINEIGTLNNSVIKV